MVDEGFIGQVFEDRRFQEELNANNRLFRESLVGWRWKVNVLLFANILLSCCAVVLLAALYFG